MNLRSVYDYPGAPRILFSLLAEREPVSSIFHKEMPTWDEHQAFVASRPHKVWYLIEVESGIVGSVYLTDKDEVGVFVFEKHKGNRYGPDAVMMLIEDQPLERHFTICNPGNATSIRMYERLGFVHIMNTYERVG